MRKETKYLVYSVSETNVKRFLRKYPNVKRMMEMSTGRNILSAYKAFLRMKNLNEAFLGGSADVVNSPFFGSKTFFKYEWYNTTGWAEVFQYIWNSRKQSH